jgi:dCTP deaminase
VILTGPEIARQVEAARIRISPFSHDALTTNSYDLRVHNKILRYESLVLDPKKQNLCVEQPIPETGLLIKRGELVLGCTHEMIGSDFYVPIIHARSSYARLGLFVHCTADLIDIGFYGRVTLQLFAVRDIVVPVGASVAQVTFWTPQGDITLYDGKYQGALGPRASEVMKDFGDSIDD